MTRPTMLVPSRPPVDIFTDVDPVEVQAFQSMLVCGGMKTPLWSRLFYFRPRALLRADEVDAEDFIVHPQVTVGKPSGTATFLKSDIEQFDRDMGENLSIHTVLEWLCWCLGSTCGVGLAYTDSNPHIRLYCLPQSKMRGAIGWTWGPPLARNRRMEYSKSVTAAYYRLRLAQHEFGHFLGHYGWPSHSNSKSDIMYPSLQHIKAHSPNWGYSDRDIAWAVKTFGPAWISAA